jgi:hypothetical protein
MRSNMLPPRRRRPPILVDDPRRRVHVTKDRRLACTGLQPVTHTAAAVELSIPTSRYSTFGFGRCPGPRSGNDYAAQQQGSATARGSR